MVITCASNFAIHEAQSKAALESLENLIDKPLSWSPVWCWGQRPAVGRLLQIQLTIACSMLLWVVPWAQGYNKTLLCGTVIDGHYLGIHFCHPWSSIKDCTWIPWKPDWKTPQLESSVMLRPKACSRKACYKYNSHSMKHAPLSSALSPRL